MNTKNFIFLKEYINNTYMKIVYTIKIIILAIENLAISLNLILQDYFTTFLVDKPEYV